jgi:5-(carboxyamino)imidazole ribonucleotide synthase
MATDRSSTSPESSPIRRVGIIGGGQLAWLMSAAAAKLGVELRVQTPQPTDPAVSIAADAIFAPIDDATATAQLAQHSDVITFENEFVDLQALARLAQADVCFRPSLTALSPLLDKYQQRSYLKDLGLPTPKFTALEEFFGLHVSQLVEQISASFGFPVVLKTRRHGYDGQGTFVLKDRQSLASVLQQVDPRSLLVEEFVPFERELAVIVARSSTGEIAVYPIVETQQKQQVCHLVLVPLSLSPTLVQEIETIAQTLMHSLQAVGVFGIELFLTSEGNVLVNEIAPRVHNSGHFTLDACKTSQFEQHLRAVCGLPLGDPALIAKGAVMVNLLGYEHSHNDYLTERQQIAKLPQAHLHWYGKAEARPGRKLGHVTVLLDESNPPAPRQQGLAVAQTISAIWYK